MRYRILFVVVLIISELLFSQFYLRVQPFISRNKYNYTSDGKVKTDTLNVNSSIRSASIWSFENLQFMHDCTDVWIEIKRVSGEESGDYPLEIRDITKNEPLIHLVQEESLIEPYIENLNYNDVHGSLYREINLKKKNQSYFIRSERYEYPHSTNTYFAYPTLLDTLREKYDEGLISETWFELKAGFGIGFSSSKDFKFTISDIIIKGSHGYGMEYIPVVLDCSADSLEFSASSSEKSIDLKTEAAWFSGHESCNAKYYVLSDADWVYSDSPCDSIYGEKTINIKTEPNNSTESRSALITIRVLSILDDIVVDDYKRIKITQLGSNGIEDNTISDYKLTNYPNPFNPSTSISYTLPSFADVKLKIYNIKGELIENLVNSKIPAGTHIVKFNASNLSSGIYYYILNINGKNAHKKKMMLIK